MYLEAHPQCLVFDESLEQPHGGRGAIEISKGCLCFWLDPHIEDDAEKVTVRFQCMSVKECKPPARAIIAHLAP